MAVKTKTIKEFLKRFNPYYYSERYLYSTFFSKYHSFFRICGDEESSIILGDDFDSRYVVTIYLLSQYYNKNEIEDMLSTIEEIGFKIDEMVKVDNGEKYWRVILFSRNSQTSLTTSQDLSNYSPKPYVDSDTAINDFINYYCGDKWMERRLEKLEKENKNYEIAIPSFLKFLKKLGINDDTIIEEIDLNLN